MLPAYITCKAGRLWRALVPAFILPLATLQGAVPVNPYFNGVFPTQSPDNTAWSTQNAFPALTFADPVWLTDVPGAEDVLVVEKYGKIKRFPKNPAVSAAEVTVVLDLGPRLQVSGDQGLYHIIFHPHFGEVGNPHANEVFICYSHRPAVPSAGILASLWRVSRFTWLPESGTIDSASESVLIQQRDPHDWHNGGAMVFDNDGFLMVTCGDGGGNNEQFGQTQKLNGGFFGGVLRIDVDNDPAKSTPINRQPAVYSTGFAADFPPSLSQGYGIPLDNPFRTDDGSTLGEFYALGLRSPHSASYDPVEGELWVGDVGDATQDELNRVARGSNCQWPYKEGTVAGPKTQTFFAGTETPPFYSYGRSMGSCIIGGMRYRGAKWSAELGGQVIFGDYNKATLNALAISPLGGPPAVNQLVTGVSFIAAISTDSAGDIYMMALDGHNGPGGTIRKLVPGTAPVTPPPALLSETGLFTDTAALEPSPALIPYQIASPLWSDGAEKKRWFAVPYSGTRNTDDEKIVYSSDGNWTFPPGSIFVKHFEIPVDARDPSLVRRLETRVMVCTTGGGKYGLTYKWNEAGTDALLLEDGAEMQFPVTATNGSVQQRAWSFPSRADCLQCHSDVSGQSLGLRSRQLNLDMPRPGTSGSVNQLTLFNEESLFTSSFVASDITSGLRSHGLADVSAPLEHRVRSYLDSNCAHCHQPGAAVSYFDARLQTPLTDQGLINGIIQGHFQMPGGCYLKPGDPSLSAVHARLASSVPGIAMPPLGKTVVDTAAVDALTTWLQGLTPEEFQIADPPSARFVRFSGSNVVNDGAIAVGEFSVLDGQGQKIPHDEVTVSAFTSEAETDGNLLVTDGDPWTPWISLGGSPTSKTITLDLGSIRPVGGMEYVPRQDSSTGRPRAYSVSYSVDGNTWTQMMSESNPGATPTSDTDLYDGLVGRRLIRCSLAAKPSSLARDFPVTVVFDTAVTDFVASDLLVRGGSVVSLAGKGYYYVATIRATQPVVTVSLPANRVNTGTYGNRAAAAINVESGMQIPPVGTFSGAPAHNQGTFEVRLAFDQPVTGLSAEDFAITGGTLEWLIPDGNGWRLILVASGQSAMTVQLKNSAVTSVGGLPSTAMPLVSVPFMTPHLEAEAETFSRVNFQVVTDPTSSGGAHIWLPEGSRADTSSSTSYAAYSNGLLTPYAQSYRLRAWTRADNLTGDTFHLVVTNSGVGSKLWQTNQGPGEVGSGQFHMGFARDAGGAPYSFALAAGNITMQLYAAEDGTRIDKIAFIPDRPFGIWSATVASPSLTRTANLHFTSAVTGLTVEDFETFQGTVTGLTGSGQDYTVTLAPSSGKMLVRLKDSAVSDEFGSLSLPSPWHFSSLYDTYDKWAAARGLGSSPENDMLDTDHDGIGQLAEYALGLEPTQWDARPLNPADPFTRGLPSFVTEPTGSGFRLNMTFDRRRWSNSVGYAAAFTGDLLDYTRQEDFTGQTEILDDEWERVTIPDASATGNETSRFGRLEIRRKTGAP